ncbi:MAG: bifunctional phosphopantothenoylcysteine decarboxylase/phosphopantothenate--cysteine ligase CoaBC [Propionibacteriaceae bacterium]|jgi:phosphopantothenoylcysteine decarboxylase/phosphopantothenate--cysteine ligase|nr:bifunctional phosphopantothenoylcysteine decarboxylase/phosphopantothenate--cysteine ligase CoaBC [Propionibacteriaceae bacterium]
MSRIVLGVAGGIAAYKSCLLLRLFAESGHNVSVVPTRNALNFVGPATWEALSGKPVSENVWARSWEVPHVGLGRSAELIVVAPATADLLARAACGRADDLLTNVLLTASCPIVMAASMHSEMWLNPATQHNVELLRGRGIVVMDPAVGRLTGPDSGPGRMPDPEDIAALALSALGVPSVAAALAARDYAGLKVLISAGGTHEAIDPVRFLGNASSGKMGLALARAARQRGAEVKLVGANLSLPAPAGVELAPVVSTADLAKEMLGSAPGADVVVMAAAPADFTPVAPSAGKVKKTGDAGLTLELRQTVDVLAALAAQADAGQVVVGFAAETASDSGELLALGRAKLARKGCRLLVLNDVSGGQVFGADENSVLIIAAGNTVEPVAAQGSKDQVAHAILDQALARRAG